MNFDLTEEQLAVQAAARDFAQTELLPGVIEGAEGSSGLYVRGGGPDQNLIILDDATVYNTNHLFGLFSVFNGDALKNIFEYAFNTDPLVTNASPLSYALVGDPVNLASRIQGLTKNFEVDILISEATRKSIDATLTVEELSAVRVKGRAEEVNVYKVV